MVEENAPSNAVLATKIDAMAATILANQTRDHEIHTQILVQTTKTNGRVTSLEKTRNVLIGALGLANLIAVPVILAYILTNLKITS